MDLEITLQDFPEGKDVNWREVASRIGIDNTLWMLDLYGGGDRKYFPAAESVRRSARDRIYSVPRNTA